MPTPQLNKPQGKKVLLGLSGNMLSSVVAALLKHQGFQVVGIHFKVSDASRSEAERVSQKLGLSLIVEDVGEDIEHYVNDNVVHQILANRKPEPEVTGHQKILIERLCAKAKELGCSRIATGHAARVALDPSTGLTRLLRSTDGLSDQSHLLFGLSSEELQQFILPIGDLGAAAVERLAIELELDPIKLRTPPPGFCAVPEEQYLAVTESRIPATMKIAGQIKTSQGSVAGDHDGLYKFYRGQNKGIPIKSDVQGDLVVVGMDHSTQTLIIGPEDLLFTPEVVLDRANWIQRMDPIKGLVCEARLGKNRLARARVTEFQYGYLHIEFAEKQRNIIPGQSIVFYAGDEVLGGGFAV